MSGDNYGAAVRSTFLLSPRRCQLELIVFLALLEFCGMVITTLIQKIWRSPLRLFCLRLPSEETAIASLSEWVGHAGSPRRIPEWVGGKRQALDQHFPCFFGQPGSISRRMVRCERFPDDAESVRITQSEPYMQSTERAVLAIAAIEGDCRSFNFDGHLDVTSAEGSILFLAGEVYRARSYDADPVFWPCIVQSPADIGRATPWFPLILRPFELSEWFRPTYGHTDLIRDLPTGSLRVKHTSYTAERPRSAFEVKPAREAWESFG
ncbi:MULTISPECIES: hypothetical protein [unclassified Maricaulis]|uniref:hypothetical protein n=1 Tax=unclassified Maricaulis TaxID=2632371 RepID=UPI001180FCB2|nr:MULTISPECIES: hypothetical protein [unclassified Maricaulis]